MSAQILEFTPYLQRPLEAGVLTPAQAWALMWEFDVTPTEPWGPGAQQLGRLVSLFYLETEDLPPQ